MRPRNRYFFLLDILLLSVIPLAALYLRLDVDTWTSPYLIALRWFTVLALAIKLPLFYAFNLYRRHWGYASVDELLSIIVAVGIAMVLLGVIAIISQTLATFPGGAVPRSLPLLDGLLTLLAVGGTRFSVRALSSTQRNLIKVAETKRVLVVGAGDAGAMMVREMRQSNKVALDPVGFVDDDWTKRGISLLGVPVLGNRKDIPRLVADYDVQEVIIAMPTASGHIIREIVALCEAAEVPSRIMPGMSSLLSGEVSVSQLRNVEIEDLLRREPVRIDSEAVTRMLTGARVLITGAGRSIGSELCRQIVRCGPARLTLLGHGENSLFMIENELRRDWPSLSLDVMVADIRDLPRLRTIFERTRPQVVFHAAAHKHVPLMESNSEDAITNNVMGTHVLVGLAENYGVECFVLISTDKAVNPVNVMGATKRVAEMIVQEAARRTERPYVSVRFGNVLGSRGSVVPLFRQQIARGGPVTVTHPDVRRYFMTIPEAVQLVLQAAALGTAEKPGAIFVLDMGEPIKIVDLARDLIELSGLEVGRDIDIVFTGLRPGERLYEELFTAGEDCRRTRHDKIFVARQSESPGSTVAGDKEGEIETLAARLIQAAEDGRAEEIRRLLKEIVSNYHSGELTADRQREPLTPRLPASRE